MKFEEHFNKMIWTLATAGIIAIVGSAGASLSTALTSIQTVKMLDALELRVSTVEIEVAVQKAIDKERHRDDNN
ncbi:hypothetical protein LCGC14_3103720 [marine sediment metagenome]|uniref:Uncharacterized protein n=1 Tax=marine sediment metagenome TaxID=412755 RepID=A0A0F8W7D3_9ZZZZ